MDKKTIAEEEFIEIDLMEYLDIIIKQKEIIVGTVLVTVIATWLASYFLLTPIYETKMTIKLGSDLDSFSELETVRERLQSSAYFAVVNKELNLNLDKEKLNKQFNNSLQLTEINDSIIELTFSNPNPNLAQRALLELGDKFSSDSNRIYQEKVLRYDNYINDITKQRERIQGQLVKLEADLNDLIASNQLSGIEKLVLKNELEQQLDRLEERDRQLFERKYQLEERRAEIRQAEIIDQPIRPTSPSSPNKKLNLAIAVVLGLFLSLFLVFALEFWDNYKARD